MINIMSSPICPLFDYVVLLLACTNISWQILYPKFLYAQQAALEEILYQFEEKLQAEREEAARKQEELQAQLQAQQAALEENQSLLRQTQEEVKGMHTKFEETNALLRAVLKLQKD